MKRNNVIEIIKRQMNKKSQYSDELILTMLRKCDENLDIQGVEPTKNGFAFNRGSLTECITTHIITKENRVCKAQKNTTDLILENEIYGLPKNAKIDIKFCTSYANGHRCTSYSDYCLLIGGGAKKTLVLLVKTSELITTKSGTININANEKNGIELKELKNVLGI